ncbi:hypothetical protein [Candidatus Poriferisodalis multihospitum]|uniref:hypothetical protein n=1 Tax=Candidatus Poriferisodalis multihospitum TaxID=2983191 RepID=UPI002B25C1D9|nr:hypothetical protein [Candidatus Poriferisodalis multihospitum]
MHRPDSRRDAEPRGSTARWRVLAAALAAAMLVSACGLLSDDDTDATTTTAADDAMMSDTDDEPTTVVTAVPTTTAAGDDMSEDEAGPDVTVESKLSTAGLGPVQIGHSLEDARTAAGSLMIAVPGGSDACRYYTVQNGPEGVRFLAVDAEIVRVDIEAGPITTISGYGIGSTRSEIIEAFGDRIEDGPGLSAIQYVPVDAPDIDKRVVWEVDEAGAVISLRAGRLPHIEPRVACTG